MIDGAILTKDMVTTFTQGEQQKVPYLIGTTDREADAIKMSLPQAEKTLGLMGFAVPKLTELYDPEHRGDKIDIATQAGTDWIFIEPARYLARQTAKAGQPTYRYRFSYVAENLRADAKGAAHATDVGFVFGGWDASRFKITPADREMAALIQRYWVNFAKSGDPNGANLPSWPRYSAEDDALLDFGRTGGATARTNVDRERLDALANVAK
jgi:para-nitrobenzyl esterase